jgi:L-fucose mutarotase
MLKGIDSLLHADLLYLLAAMGHGDELAIVDRNFPAVAKSQRLARLEGSDLCRAGQAIISVFPIDDFEPAPLTGMQCPDAPGGKPDVQLDFLRLVEAAEGRPVSMATVSRQDFYARSSAAFGVVTTSETRPYGCVLLTKGVIR